MKISTLISDGKWFKGNTHCHTSLSDGRWSPGEVAKLYRDNGYSFLFISDHRWFGVHDELSSDDFLVIPSMESDVSDPDSAHHCFHIVGGFDPGANRMPYSAGPKAMPEWAGTGAAQIIIDDLAEHGNLSILAHPVWSRNDLSEIKALKGLTGMEIYNNVCEYEWHNGNSVLYWDLLWKEGFRIWGLASDDTHDPATHALGGWIVVKAEDLSVKSIMKSLRNGSFYSSTGPEIYDFYVENNMAYLDCSEVAAIHFMTYDDLGRSFRATPGDSLTSAHHQLTGREKFVRAEIHDKDGRIAWSNPIEI